MFARHGFLLCLAVYFAMPSLVFAQGSRADYLRAQSLRERYANKVFGAERPLEWSADGESFTYIMHHDGGCARFIVTAVDAPEPCSAFDHEKMAEALGRFLSEELSPQHLPIQWFRKNEDGTITARTGRRFFHYDPVTDVITDAWEQVLAENTLPRSFRRQRSSHTGSATQVLFVNTLTENASLFWINSANEEIPYGEVPADDTRMMETYAGHAWLVRSATGDNLGVYVAQSRPGQVNITDAPAENPRETPEKPQRNQSPDGQYTAFIREHNVFIRSTAPDAGEVQLTRDGTAEHHYREPIFWSPDSRKLAAMRTLRGDDRDVHYVESSPRDQLQPKLHHYHYLKPGDRIPLTKPCLFDIPGRCAIPISDELFPNPWSVSEFSFSADSARFYFLYNQRGHQVMRYVCVNTDTGRTYAVIDEPCETFFDYNSKCFLRKIDAAGEVIWMSERDGWNHLYLVDAETGEVKNQITRGEWVVRRVEKVDTEKRVIHFFAGGVHPDQDPYFLHYCRVNFDGTDFRVLTDGDGTHAIRYSPNGKYIIDTYSRVDLPPEHLLLDAETGRHIARLAPADITGLYEAGWRMPERFCAKGRDGETDIHGVIFFPTRYVSGRRYPVIENIYAGPHGQSVPKKFQAFFEMQVLAELGFIVVSIDGMGTNFRWKAFHDVCWKNLGDAGFPDRILWMKAAAEKYPSMDLTRVGIYGGSAGGQNAMRALLAHGDFYKVAVADCGCHDNRMDKIWWNELWMGWPVGPHYQQQSNVTQAHRLTGKLLLIVGEKDENVDPASTMQVADALIRADKDFELLVMPGVGHGAAGHPYAARRLRDFFVRHLHGVEPRWEENGDREQ